MKKFIALALTAALAISMVACGAKNDGGEDNKDEAAYKTGVGAVISVKATDETAEKGSYAQVNTTIVAASFDAEGKVVSATIDVAQNQAQFNAEGKLDGEIDLRTKNEKGDEYNMVKYGNAIAEIDKQHQALAEYFVGKTVEEIKAIPTQARDDNHPAVPADEDLKASVTITIQDYVAAIEKAYKNAVPTSAPVAKTGLGIVVNGTAKDEDGDKGASAKFDTTFMVVALDEKDTVVGAQVDVAEQEVKFDVNGAVEGETVLETKNERGDNYGMKAASGIGKEMFEQHQAFAEWMVGKKASDISGVKEDDEDLKASITVNMTSYMEAFGKAVKNAK